MKPPILFPDFTGIDTEVVGRCPSNRNSDSPTHRELKIKNETSLEFTVRGSGARHRAQDENDLELPVRRGGAVLYES